MSELIALHLMKAYRNKTVVHDVSVTIKAGEIVGLLGPNGAGKTTLFYMIVGLVKSDNGSITFNGTDITHLPIHARAKLGLGYLPQEASVFRKLTVEQNIMAILELRGDIPEKKDRQLIVDDLLEEFHITHLRQSLGVSLSGGERRRLEIARTLAMDPQFILLDEPFAGIDPISVIDIKHIISHLKKRGIGVLITDHNVRETLDTCERAYIVNQGKVLCEGSPETILNDQTVRDIYLGEDFK